MNISIQFKLFPKVVQLTRIQIAQYTFYLHKYSYELQFLSEKIRKYK